ncbi:aquaporin [Mycoplasmopsis fermentans]|nr:aquaporin [Mycoplasmopsis fermentans]ADN68840.1 hypothetical membrane spanning protein [Mycoplasmopsis fermentans JER]ADV34284.1 Hypothetical Protein MfeM64YM_0280 [Mycoplasmopsis fermentans M64]VEU60309.1 Uncharacterised protein [Mycoplasmopsis fermentans]VEU67450.1 Uncharacterised protein [Mesomycoplasma conjunctivae]
MFNYFNLKNRQAAVQPTKAIHWFSHLFSELIGTIWISLGLAGLSIIIKDKVVEHYLLHNVIVGFFAGFVVVGSCLIFFGRWSVDLNPVVTLYRWFNGTNKTGYVMAKLAMQIVGGILAGLIIYGIGHNASGIKFEANYLANATDTAHKANHYISAHNVSAKSFMPNFDSAFAKEAVITKKTIWSGGVWIFFGEMVLGAILLFPIFSPRLDNKYRDTFICFIISFDVWMGILLGSAAINPVRGLAQQVPTLFFDMKHLSAMAQYDIHMGTWAMVLGNLMSPVFHAFMQGFTEKYGNPALLWMLNYKNNKASHYVKETQTKEESVKKNN